MIINFHTYNGLAGDEHLLLIAETDCGIKKSCLVGRSSFSLYFARKKLIRRIKNQRIEI
jgi:hypothetical protein